MPKSMTGFGRGEADADGKRVIVEAKSVNHRFLEIGVRLPRGYSSFEERIRKVIKDRVMRGHVDIFCTIENSGVKMRQVKVDKDLAMAYHQSLREIALTLGILDNTGAMDIAQFPDVLRVEDVQEDPEILWSLLEGAVLTSLAGLNQMRQEEGIRLADDLQQRLSLIGQEVDEINSRAPVMVSDYHQRLLTRLREFKVDLNPGLEEQRVAMEVALFADRSSITEEVVRIKSHLTMFGEALKGSDPVGRKLDFITQELNREINTIGSKSTDIEASKKVVVVKSEIEKIREQVQNIE